MPSKPQQFTSQKKKKKEKQRIEVSGPSVKSRTTTI